jgi:hypothetical protein
MRLTWSGGMRKRPSFCIWIEAWGAGNGAAAGGWWAGALTGGCALARQPAAPPKPPTLQHHARTHRQRQVVDVHVRAGFCLLVGDLVAVALVVRAAAGGGLDRHGHLLRAGGGLGHTRAEDRLGDAQAHGAVGVDDPGEVLAAQGAGRAGRVAKWVGAACRTEERATRGRMQAVTCAWRRPPCGPCGCAPSPDGGAAVGRRQRLAHGHPARLVLLRQDAAEGRASGGAGSAWTANPRAALAATCSCVRRGTEPQAGCALAWACPRTCGGRAGRSPGRTRSTLGSCARCGWCRSWGRMAFAEGRARRVSPCERAAAATGGGTRSAGAPARGPAAPRQDLRRRGGVGHNHHVLVGGAEAQERPRGRLLHVAQLQRSDVVVPPVVGQDAWEGEAAGGSSVRARPRAGARASERLPLACGGSGRPGAPARSHPNRAPSSGQLLGASGTLYRSSVAARHQRIASASSSGASSAANATGLASANAAAAAAAAAARSGSRNAGASMGPHERGAHGGACVWEPPRRGARRAADGYVRAAAGPAAAGAGSIAPTPRCRAIGRGARRRWEAVRGAQRGAEGREGRWRLPGPAAARGS